MSNVAWLESLSPWPKDGFGLGRMKALLAELGDPQLAYPSIHVVGTNGKSTTARTIEATLAREGRLTACYTSPHVTGWAERVRIGGEEADIERVLARVREPGERLGATQFEVLTAAAFAEFAAAGVEAAVVEAGLGGRHDATNVLRSPVQVLTNVALEHTDVLGSSRAAIAAEKLAVVRPGSTVCLGEPEWEPLALANGAARVIVERGGNAALAGVAASVFLGREVEPADVALPGRLEQLDGEIRDGAHTSDAVRYVAAHLPRSARSSRRSSPTRTSRACSGSSGSWRPCSSRPAPRAPGRCPPRSSRSARDRGSSSSRRCRNPWRRSRGHMSSASPSS